MVNNKKITILGIESSCDDTSAAVVQDGYVLSNEIANQTIHKSYGGVVPELASRAHQQNIIPVIDQALQRAGVKRNEISAVAYTRGPGLMGSLLVGTSFAKGFALGQQIPIVDVNHLHAHIISLFLRQHGDTHDVPGFPFLCLLISGGHSQIMIIRDHLSSDIIGQTIDDAAGEAFDKCAKVMGLPYPGGPHIDRLAKEGNAKAFEFSKPRIKNLDYSFSGLKTSFLYFLRDKLQQNANFMDENKPDIAASLQNSIIDILMEKLELASQQTGIKEVAIAGGVSANSGVRNALIERSTSHNWKVHIPAISYSTDNGAMIALAGYYKFLQNDISDLGQVPFARIKSLDV